MKSDSVIGVLICCVCLSLTNGIPVTSIQTIDGQHLDGFMKARHEIADDELMEYMDAIMLDSDQGSPSVDSSTRSVSEQNDPNPNNERIHRSVKVVGNREPNTPMDISRSSSAASSSNRQYMGKGSGENNMPTSSLNIERQMELNLLNELPTARSQNVTAMIDYDPSKTEWPLHLGALVFNSYSDAYNYVQNTKLAARFVEWKYNVGSDLRVLKHDLSYVNPSGGLILESPYQYGVQFSDTELSWHASFEYADERFLIGYFANSRLAALAYDKFVLQNRLLRYVDEDFPLNVVSDRHVNAKDLHEIQMTLARLDRAFR